MEFGKLILQKITKIVATGHHIINHTHTHTHPFNGPFSGITQVSQYQKGKTQSGFY